MNLVWIWNLLKLYHILTTKHDHKLWIIVHYSSSKWENIYYHFDPFSFMTRDSSRNTYQSSISFNFTIQTFKQKCLMQKYNNKKEKLNSIFLLDYEWLQLINVNDITMKWMINNWFDNTLLSRMLLFGDISIVINLILSANLLRIISSILRTNTINIKKKYLERMILKLELNF